MFLHHVPRPQRFSQVIELLHSQCGQLTRKWATLGQTDHLLFTAEAQILFFNVSLEETLFSMDTVLKIQIPANSTHLWKGNEWTCQRFVFAGWEKCCQGEERECKHTMFTCFQRRKIKQHNTIVEFSFQLMLKNSPTPETSSGTAAITSILV